MMEDIVQSDIRTEDNHPFVNNAPLILDKRLLNRPPERPSNKSHNDNIIMRKQTNNEIDIDESLTYKDTYILNIAQMSNESFSIIFLKDIDILLFIIIYL